jgi:hypothetical protein
MRFDVINGILCDIIIIIYVIYIYICLYLDLCGKVIDHRDHESLDTRPPFLGKAL